MIDAHFQLYSPGARRLYHFEGHEDQAVLTAEIRRTLDGLASAARARIGRGLTTPAEAERVVVLWLAIAEDLEAWTLNGPAWLQTGPTIAERHSTLHAKNGVAWADKVLALRREIQARRSTQDGEVAKGRLTVEAAKEQLERLEAVHDLFWRHGFAFDGTRDELRAMSGPILDTYPSNEQEQAA